MKLSISEKLISQHLLEGQMEPGEEIALRIDHTLIQDSTGTLADLQLEAIGVDLVKAELCLSFVDHNTLQGDHRNADDHAYLRTVAGRHGLTFSRPGNGICHQVYLERFSKPGRTLLGSDSHTPTAGGAGVLAMGAGGLDVAAAMAGEPFYLKMPIIVSIELTGSLPEFVSAKDVILEVLRRTGVKGAVEKILEYRGPGVETLSVPERGTITNMGTETGATTSIFPSDEVTKIFMETQGRGNDYQEIKADADASYGEEMHINLSGLEPLVALPHSPGNVARVADVVGTPVDQVCIGSCTNSSLRDLKIVAQLLKGRKISRGISLTVSPGTRQVLDHLTESGELGYLIKAGARILECACGPCIGMGQAPATDSVSLRTFNRNFKGRCGTESAGVYLVSPETAVASAIHGVITDPRSLGHYPTIKMPRRFTVNDNLIVKPSEGKTDVEVIRGPNIRPLPEFPPLEETLEGEVLLKLGDDITTDDILPGGAHVLPLRSNIPEISKYTFKAVDPGFYARSLAKGGGFVVGGTNYGQGSSREHAAMSPKYLGVKAILAKSFARIHLTNLVNFGIVPLTFVDEDDYDKVRRGDSLRLELGNLRGDLSLENLTTGSRIRVAHGLGERNLEVLSMGGKLPYIKSRA
ncbi:aconitate hydratase [Candidatus Bathyarchaeota archaeon]|jgi:aconitate hydratase|nr:aconitate hydratase [Candidatus Bathyarchaeota archaeon]